MAYNISNFILDLNKNCSKVQKKSFKKGEVITSYIEKRNQLCILETGNAELIRYDMNGDKYIIERFSANDIFGEIFYTVSTNNELFVEAKNKCTVLFLLFDNFYDTCNLNCRISRKFIKKFSSTFFK